MFTPTPGSTNISRLKQCNVINISVVSVPIMPDIKLYYFEYPFWRADVPRLSLQLANVSKIKKRF